MNKDLLLDAIGMVDEQTLREAADIKHTKRVTGCVAAIMVLLAVLVTVGVLWLASCIINEEVHPYTVDMLVNQMASSNTVTVYPDGQSQNSYAIAVPPDFENTLCLPQWRADDTADITQSERLSLRIGKTTLTLYDNYATARMHDWDLFVGTFVIPEGLWQEVAQVLTP